MGMKMKCICKIWKQEKKTQKKNEIPKKTCKFAKHPLKLKILLADFASPKRLESPSNSLTFMIFMT